MALTWYAPAEVKAAVPAPVGAIVFVQRFRTDKVDQVVRIKGCLADMKSVKLRVVPVEGRGCQWVVPAVQYTGGRGHGESLLDETPRRAVVAAFVLLHQVLDTKGRRGASTSFMSLVTCWLVSKLPKLNGRTCPLLNVKTMCGLNVRVLVRLNVPWTAYQLRRPCS